MDGWMDGRARPLSGAPGVSVVRLNERTMVRATKRKAAAPKATSRTAGTCYIYIYDDDDDDDDDANDDDANDARIATSSSIGRFVGRGEDADRRACETTERLTR